MKKKFDKHKNFYKYLLKIPYINSSVQGNNMEGELKECVNSPLPSVYLPTVSLVRNDNEAITGFISSSPEDEEIYTQLEKESIQGFISSSPEEEEIYTGYGNIIYSGHSVSPAPDRCLSDSDY